MLNEINIVKPNDELVTRLVPKYIKTFEGPPWNEYAKCNSPPCDNYGGTEITIGSPCDCGGQFTAYYPPAEVLQYITNESKKPNFRLAILGDTENPTGFAWSYETRVQKLVSDKWTNKKDQAQILQAINSIGLNSVSTIRYFSECGINPPLRGQGLANKLVEPMVDSKLPTIYRTNYQSPMMAVAEKLSFTQIYGPNVIVIRGGKNIDTGDTARFREKQNPDRVLFIRQPQ